jgi:hypothetical protein
LYFYFILNFYFCRFFLYYFDSNLTELKLSCEKGNISNDKVLVTYYGASSKYITVFFLIFFGVIFQTLIEYNSTETLLLSSFILVFFIIVFIISDGFLDFRGDFFFNTLDTFAFSYKLKSLKINKIRFDCFYSDLNLPYRLNTSVSALNFFKKFNLNKTFLFEEDAAIFHNFFFFDWHRTITNNTH